ncbi:MAG: transketolase-like TK C-terminal-containing protein, partial [Acidimicrobiia bacterium]
ARALPEGALDGLVGFEAGASLATRAASGKVLSALAERIPELVGGSADLAESTSLALPGPPVRAGDYRGRVLHFGVREHAMAAMANGLALHGGFRPVVSTFLIFSDYLRPALRLSALMGQPVVYVFTHDSVGLGEDGPTHQPVEHLEALRAMPNLAVLRPADAHETAEAWAVALARTDGPTALVLSRQALPVLPPHSSSTADGPAHAGWLVSQGARVVRRTGGRAPDVVLVATGSEVGLSLAAADQLDQANVAAQVVSMPWRERFEELHPADQEALLPCGVPRLVVEAASPTGWRAVAGERGRIHGLRRFGASAPGPVALAGLGFSAEAVAAAAVDLLARGADT